MDHELDGPPSASARGIPIRRADACSIPSALHPQRNEDALFVDTGRGIAAVYDGMGGMANGAIASRLGRDPARELAANVAQWGLEWPRRVIEAARAVHQQVNAAAPSGSRMGSTAVVAAVAGDQLSVAWCGDSRAYVLYGDGHSEAITTDHNLIYQAQLEGSITKGQAVWFDHVLDNATDVDDAVRLGALRAPSLWEGISSLAAARMGREYAQWFYTRRNIVASSLDSGPIDEKRMRIDEVVAVMLTTDGVHDNLAVGDVQAIARRAVAQNHIDGLAAEVVDEAARVASSGSGRAKPDDITAVVLKVKAAQ